MSLRRGKGLDSDIPTSWLPELQLPAGLQCLEMRGLDLVGRALPDLLPSLLQTRELTSLVLQGADDHDNTGADDAGVAALAAYLPFPDRTRSSGPARCGDQRRWSKRAWARICLTSRGCALLI